MDVAATRHFHTPLPDSWGKGGRKKNVDLDWALKVTFVFSIIPNLCWSSSLSCDFKLCEEECNTWLSQGEVARAFSLNQLPEARLSCLKS